MALKLSGHVVGLGLKVGLDATDLGTTILEADPLEPRQAGFQPHQKGCGLLSCFWQ